MDQTTSCNHQSTLQAQINAHMILGLSSKLHWQYPYFLNSKTKGPGDIQKFRLRNWPISSADFSSTLLWKGQSIILALFRKRILGQYPAAPCSPGPFVLLLNSTCPKIERGEKTPTPKISALLRKRPFLW